MSNVFLNSRGPYVSLEKEKQNFCVVLSYYLKRAREIRKFHVAVVQQRLRNVQKCVMHVQRCFFCQSKPVVFFAVCRCRCKNSLLFSSRENDSLLFSSRNFATIVTWCHNNNNNWYNLITYIAQVFIQMIKCTLHQ